MSKVRLGVLGASGFVGSTLCEHAFFDGEFDVVPFIHTFGRATRVARLPIPLVQVDVLDRPQVLAALDRCDIVVNCYRDVPDVMWRGLKNIVRALKGRQDKRLIHLSSIAIYGTDPSPESATEEASPTPDEVYGYVKARQDDLVLDLHASGVPAVIICPANIYGPYSPFILGIRRLLVSGGIVLVDGGERPTNNVHVGNVVEAILTAARSPRGWGARYFVNDGEPVTWRQFFGDMERILGLKTSLDSVAETEVRRMLDGKARRLDVVDTLRIAASGEFRAALGLLPIFRRMNDWTYRTFMRLSPRLQARIREKLERPLAIAKERHGPDLSHKFIREQLRTVFHSPERIQRQLGYKQLLTYREGMETVRAWLEFANLAPVPGVQAQ